jgi:hypothetical protein
MSVILLILGIVVAAAGTATLGFGITINEFSLGTTSIIAGTTALTGGLILIGLSAVVTELGRVAEGLRARVAARPAGRPAEAPEPVALAAAAVAASGPALSARPPQANVPVPQRPRPEAPVREIRAPEPYPPTAQSAVEVSAAAIERLRSSIPRTERPRAESGVDADIEEVPLSPNGAAHHQPQQARHSGVAAAPPAPKVTAEDRAGGAAVEALKASRLDFLFRSKQTARSAPQPQPQPENFDTFWPADGRPAGRSADTEPQLRIDEIQRQTDYPSPAQDRPVQDWSVQDRRADPAPAEPAAILKSGVVDGMAYTLYADGSIEAKLPHGTVRFGSIAELRAHIENNS